MATSPEDILLGNNIIGLIETSLQEQLNNLSNPIDLVTNPVDPNIKSAIDRIVAGFVSQQVFAVLNEPTRVAAIRQIIIEKLRKIL
jgi:hypothetical protein